MAVTAEFDRALVRDLPGAFLSYGMGSDMDAAFDEAALADRLELGSAGVSPSLATVDPASVRQVSEVPVHPHVALERALAFAAGAAPGEVWAQAVHPLKVYAHRQISVHLTDPALPFPSHPGPLWGSPEVLAAAADAADLGEGEAAVSVVVPRLGSARWKARAEAVSGAKVTRFAVFRAGNPAPLSIHETASLARKAALSLARDKSGGSGEWHVLPIVTRPGGEPFVRVVRERVSCRVPVRVLAARLKDPARSELVAGWLFAGRMPDAKPPLV